MAGIDEIKNKHQYVVWDKVGKDNAKGLLERLKTQLMTEHELTEDDEISFIAYAMEKESILVLAADRG